MPEVGDQWLPLMLAATLPSACVGLVLLWTAHSSTRSDVNIHRSPGVRTGTTLRSREAWLAAHHAVKRPTLWAGYVLSALALVCACIGLFGDVRDAIVLELVVLMTTPLHCLYIAWQANKAARAL